MILRPLWDHKMKEASSGPWFSDPAHIGFPYQEELGVVAKLGNSALHRFPELTYAHARMARQNITQVLAGKVQAGLFGEDQAAVIGRALLRENGTARRSLRLPDVRSSVGGQVGVGVFQLQNWPVKS